MYLVNRIIILLVQQVPLRLTERLWVLLYYDGILLDDLIVAFSLVETLFWVRGEGYLEVFVGSGEAVRRDFVLGLELAELGGGVQVDQTF